MTRRVRLVEVVFCREMTICAKTKAAVRQPRAWTEGMRPGAGV